MSSSQYNRLTRRFLDGDLGPEEEADALRRIAEDPSARALLRLDGHLRRELRRSPEPADVPNGFADQVMQKLPARELPSTADGHGTGGVAERLEVWGRRLLQPYSLTWRPAYTLVAAAVLLGTAAMLLISSPFYGAPLPSPSNAPEKTAASTKAGRLASTHRVHVRLTYVSNAASSVAVAGDFTHWQPVPLSPQQVDGQTIWATQLSLAPEKHHYMFVLNGTRWVTDPLALFHQEDRFGRRNAVLML